MFKKAQKASIIEELKDRSKSARKAFVNVDLNRAKFKGLDLSGIDFSGSSLRETLFEDCNLAKSSFRAADLSFAVFDSCIFQETIFEFVRIHRAQFRNCKLEGVDFRDAQAEETQFTGSQINGLFCEGAVFNNSTIRDCRINDAKARRSLFEGSYFIGSIFTQADFTAVIFKAATWKNTGFGKVLFSASIGYGVGISRCTFESCDFFKADFRNAYSLPKDLRQEISGQGGLVNPDYLNLLWKKGYIRIALGFLFLFLLIFLAQLSFNPDFWTARKALNEARKAQKKGMLNKAAAILEANLTKRISEDELGETYLLQANIKRDLGQTQEARQLYGRITAMSKSKWYALDARMRIAELGIKEKRIDEAIKAYKEIIEYAPEESADVRDWAKIGLGDIYRGCGRLEEARKLYEEVIKDERLPQEQRVEAKLRMIELLRASGKNKEALELSRETMGQIKDAGQKDRLEKIMRGIPQ